MPLAGTPTVYQYAYNGYPGGELRGSVNISQNNGYLTIHKPIGDGPTSVTVSSVFFNNKIDITNFKTLHIKELASVKPAFGTRYVEIILTKEIKQSYTANFIQKIGSQTEIREYDWNISAMEGEYYLAICICDVSSIQIYDLEFRL